MKTKKYNIICVCNKATSKKVCESCPKGKKINPIITMYCEWWKRDLKGYE